MPHSHDHGQCCECCQGNSGLDNPLEMGTEYSLYVKIDMTNLECLNEGTDGSGRNVFKPFEERLNFDKYVESDADEELLFNIPFNGNIKLKGIIIIGGDDDSHPSRVKLYKNRPKMTFDDTKLKADQEFELHKDATGTMEYPTKIVNFSSVYHLSLHFPSSFGGDNTRIYYIGLRGEFTQAHHHGVTICTYEAKPNITDHKTDLVQNMAHQIQ